VLAAATYNILEVCLPAQGFTSFKPFSLLWTLFFRVNMMGSSRPHQSHSRQQIANVHTRPHAATPHVHDEPSPPYATPGGSYSTGAQHGASPVSRQGTPVAFPVGTSHLFVQLEQPASRVTPPPAAPVKAARNRNGGNSSGSKPATLASPVPGKSRRVRTGCLTCRERHLKCDERLPDCNNCRKSNRECRRGIRLNFIDVQVNDPPCVPPTTEWSGMSFCPRSRPPLVTTGS
jgi:hypothetical protein